MWSTSHTVIPPFPEGTLPWSLPFLKYHEVPTRVRVDVWRRLHLSYLASTEHGLFCGGCPRPKPKPARKCTVCFKGVNPEIFVAHVVACSGGV
jgi:hypothetical protein